MTGMPGMPTDLPLPPAIAETLGYTGTARFVAFAHSPAGDSLIVDDGQDSRDGETQAFLAYRRHPAVKPLLESYNLGSSNRIAEHAMILDRERNLASIAPVRDALAFIEAQHPPLTPEQEEAMRKKFEAQPGWYETRPDPAEIGRRIAEQRGRVKRLISWLDQCPTPGPGGRGA